MGTQGDRVKYIGLRVPPDLHREFWEAAKANHRSLEGELKALMEQRIRDFIEDRATA
jgi:predicted HicB family RNase H-like nuclease